MSSVGTQRLTALGALCRRPTATLILLTPFVLLAFAGVLLAGTIRASWIRRSSAEIAVLDSAVSESVHQPTSRLGRGLAAVRPTPSRAFGAAGALFAGILVAASMAGGTYAFLNSRATTSAVTISSGNLAVTLQYGSGTAGTSVVLPAAAYTNMLPGDIVGQQVTVSNTGSATASLVFRLAANSAWDVRVAWGTCPTTQVASGPLSTTPTVGSTIPSGFSSTMCVQTTLPITAAASAQSTTVPFTMYIDANQVSP